MLNLEELRIEVGPSIFLGWNRLFPTPIRKAGFGPKFETAFIPTKRGPPLNTSFTKLIIHMSRFKLFLSFDNVLFKMGIFEYV